MPARKTASGPKKMVILLVEADVLVRFALADHLRNCNLQVIEASGADDARAVLVAGPKIDVLLCDAQLAGGGSGFVLAQWVRRHRREIEVLLTASVASKAQAAAELAARDPASKPPSDAAGLLTKLSAMSAERKRRLRQQPRAENAGLARRKRV